MKQNNFIEGELVYGLGDCLIVMANGKPISLVEWISRLNMEGIRVRITVEPFTRKEK